MRSIDFMDAWVLGAAAGRADGLAEGWRWRCLPQPAQSPAPAVDSGEQGPGGQDFPLAWRCVGELPLWVALAQFAPGEPRHARFAGRQLDRVCTDKGVTRLYLPVALVSTGPPQEETGDPLGDQGYRHGTVRESLAEAARETVPAQPSRVPYFAGLVRYEPVGEHDFWDLLPLDGNLPPVHG